MWKNSFSLLWQKYLSVMLVFLLLISQTIHVDFFDEAAASPEQYRDVVSLFVDRDTYDELSSKIRRYANDIQGYLSATRVSVFVVDTGTPVESLASKNEKLYYEGDGGEGVSGLVGTILLGNVPLPMVEHDGASFPSVYPYVDFVDKEFVFDPIAKKYHTSLVSTNKQVEPEIWHGVINPAVGRAWSSEDDIKKISTFLDKTHEFYTKSGKFAPSSIPPRVFYYDGFADSKSTSLKSLLQYTLTMRNSENIAYNRFTKYLLDDINATINAFDSTQNTEVDAFLRSRGIDPGKDTLDKEAIQNLPDIQTKTPILSILKDFSSVINDKTLSDAFAFVHNAGRYNTGSTVRADLAPVSVTLRDTLARTMLRDINTAMMESFDKTLLERKIPRKIAIFDSVTVGNRTNSNTPRVYTNYFFGQKSTTVTTPEMCTIARGSTGTITPFGRDVLVEANTLYDISATEKHIALLKKDTDALTAFQKNAAYSCFDTSGKAKLDAYWGGNSILRIAGGGENPGNLIFADPTGTKLTGMSESIFSLGGMRETNRLTESSVLDCTNPSRQYALAEPYIYTYSVPRGLSSETCRTGFPTEWNKDRSVCRDDLDGRIPRYTCLTNHIPLSTIPEFTQSLSDYTSRGCYSGSLTLDGRVIQSANRSCGDSTMYESQVYHTIPSLLRHVSPTTAEIDAATKNTMTPSLGVDMVRSVEFLTPKGNRAVVEYPNFFEMQGNDIPSVRAWLTDMSQKTWNAIIQNEQNTPESAASLAAKVYLSDFSGSLAPLDWNNLISDTVIQKALRAKYWLTPDIADKSIRTVETALSYSGEYLSGKIAPPVLPQNKGGYEIAYLGLTPFSPSGTDDDFATQNQAYENALLELQSFNIASTTERENQNPSNTNQNRSDKCGPPEGVDLFKWPQALMCWIASLTPPRITGGSCSTNTIGLSSSTAPLSRPDASLADDSVRLRAFYAGMGVYYSVARTSLHLEDTLDITFHAAKGDTLLDLPSGAKAVVNIIGGQDQNGNVIPVSRLSEYAEIAPTQTEVIDGKAKFLVSSHDKIGKITLQATFTLPFADGEQLSLTSDALTLTLTDEYIDPSLRIDGVNTSSVPVTTATGVSLDAPVIQGTGGTVAPTYPLIVDIRDSVSENLILSGQVLQNSGAVLPRNIFSTPGVYALTVRDALGRFGQTEFSVVSGPLSQIQISTVSSAFLRGQNTLSYLRLSDAKGNPISPDLHTLEVEVSGGYILTQDGIKQTKMRIDAMEGEIPLLLSSDTAGTMTMTVRVPSLNLSTTKTIRVLSSARLILSRGATPTVGGNPVDMTARIVDENNAVVSGFDSVMTLDIDSSLGSFSESVIPIKNGISSTFQFFPGTRAGNHKMHATVLGIGTIADIAYSVSPGPALYVSHRVDDASISLFLADRYGNPTDETLTGTFIHDTRSTQSFAFVDGKFQLPKIAGKYRVSVPGLTSRTLSTLSAGNTYTFRGISEYVFSVGEMNEKFDFLPDYNARYTVLAGGSFLREAEDILYNTLPGASQSLAVSTLLDSPFGENTLVSLTSRGALSLSDTNTTVIDSSVSLVNGYPLIALEDDVSREMVAEILVKNTNPLLRICDDLRGCLVGEKNMIALALGEGTTNIQIVETGEGLILRKSSEDILRVKEDGRIVLTSGVQLSVSRETLSSDGLVLDVLLGGQKIASLLSVFAKNASITPVPSIGNVPADAPGLFLQKYRFSLEPFSRDVLFGENPGYKIVARETTQVLDTYKNTLNTREGIGMISESPGVGWSTTNSMLLSYAGGDTVGEASKFFHTFTFINLGDPVTHNDTPSSSTSQEGLDKSLGHALTSPSRTLSHFAERDMDNDGYEDILAFYEDGSVELFLNLRDKFRSRGTIAYLPDFQNQHIALGDFSGDGYADIIGVSQSGSLALITNANRKFSRSEIRLASGTPAPTGVSQFRVYDMDNDKKDDIVFLTDTGKLGILYGTATPGLFDEKVLDASLGITLSPIPDNGGGALYHPGVPQDIVFTSTSDEVNDGIIKSEVYYQQSPLQNTTSDRVFDPGTQTGMLALSGTISSLGEGASTSSLRTYVKSQYASLHGVEVGKIFENVSSSSLRAGDTVRAKITLKNTGGVPLSNLEYLDSIPSIFDISDTSSYTITRGATQLESAFETLSASDYDTRFIIPRIEVGETVTVSYEMKALPASYGEMLVGDFESDESGKDPFGDVGFKASNTCGADMIVWRSGPLSRDYTKGTRTFAQPTLPQSLSDSLTDTNTNGIPDAMETAATGALDTFSQSVSPGSSSTKPLQITTDPTNRVIDIGLSPDTEKDVDTIAKNIADGLSCGFGGGSCMSFPINWAPLAPGSAPVVFGYPLSSLVPSTGTPVFSAMTCQLVTVMCGNAPCTIGIPTVYPANPMGANMYSVVPGANNGAACGNPTYMNGAGGRLGIDSQMNFLRVYVTPTLTLGMGTAMCFGGTARLYGNKPGKALWPLTQGGNCIVTTQAMPVCKNDGSSADGDVRGVSGLGSTTDAWNAGSCELRLGGLGDNDSKTLEQDIINYLKNPDTTKLNALYERLAKRGNRTQDVGTFLRLGGGTGPSASGLGVGVTIDTAKPLSSQNIVKLKNKRVAAFPDFIMDWVARQTEELTNGLLSAPNLTIIPPTSLGQNGNFDSSFKDFLKESDQAYSAQTVEDIKSAMGDAYQQEIANGTTTTQLQNRTRSSNNATSDIGKWIQSQTQSFERRQDSLFAGELKGVTENTQGGLSAMRAAYKLIGKLPLISLSERQIPINVPWILPQELDRYVRSLDAYKEEFDQTMKDFCANDQSRECLEKKAKLQSSGFTNSLNQNLKRIEEYKNFPTKLQKYVTWKQRYMSQILCNIETIQQMTNGWLKENGVRFRKWAELYVLIKGIADSWQPLLDIFATTSAQCGVCRNERYNAQYYKIKLLSAIIPDLPIIKFPRWPDVILDLHDIRIGLHIAVPDFRFRLNPIRLPELGDLNLPNAPNASLSLPSIPELPKLPNLPDLPDLPSLPKVALPNLPPPPKLPKIFGSVSSFLSIAKTIAKLYCYYQKTALVPEWNVGDVIAQRTERQGTLPMDFLNLQFPNLSVSSLKNIVVSSHVNFEMETDFLAEFARSAVKPLNEFTADISRGMPKKLTPDVNIQSPQNINIDVNLSGATVRPAGLLNIQKSLEKDAQVTMEGHNFFSYFTSELRLHPETSYLASSLQKEQEKAQKEADRDTDELITYNTERFAALKKYIQYHYDETAKMQNIIDVLREKSPALLAQTEHPRLLVADEGAQNVSTTLAHDFNTEYVGSLDTSTRILQKDTPLSPLTTSLLDRARRLVANTTLPSTNATNTQVPSAYTPSFQGIYILTESGVQTRLFDYIEPLTGEEKIQKKDIDKDGDMDYLFDFGGRLFIKYTTKNTPNPIRDTTVQVSTLESSLPTAPNFFHQDKNTPNALSLEFSAAQKYSENIWRMEMYDRYLEWDMFGRGGHDADSAPKKVAEFFLQDASLTGEVIVPRILDRLSDTTSVVLSGPSMRKLSAGSQFRLSAGTKIYTGRAPAVITSGQPSVTKTLLPARGYSFSGAVDVTVDRGSLYVFSALSRQTYTGSIDDFIGMPLLPGTRIFAGEMGTFDVLDTLHDATLRFGKGTEYMSVPLGSEQDLYRASISAPDGWYHASLESVTGEKVTPSRVTLLSPQKSFDTSPPEVDIGELLRIPIYQKQEYPLADFISEMHQYSVAVDEDLSQDTNANGIYDDDFTASGTYFALSPTRLVIGPFSTLGTREMRLRVTDELGNTTYKDVSIDIYAPIPSIVSASSLGFSGVLDESLSREPIDVFRVRSGSPLTQITTSPSFTNIEGAFTSSGLVFQSGAQMTFSGGSIGLSERGVFSALPQSTRIDVLPANGIHPLQFDFFGPNGTRAYSQFFSLPSLPIVTTASGYTGAYIHINAESPTRVAPASGLDPLFPLGAYITNASYKPLAVVAADGNIYLFDSTLRLVYAPSGTLLGVDIMNGNTRVASIVYHVDFFYTAK